MTTRESDSSDLTIAEIHRIRERIFDAFAGDAHAIAEDARRRQELSGRPTVSYAKPTEAVSGIDAR